MRLKLATSLKNKTSSLARDPRLLNSVVDTKGRVQKRPSLVASFGPVTVGNGLGLFVRNTPGAPGVPAIPELITITGAVITTAPATYFDATHTLTAVEAGVDIFGMQAGLGSITPTTFNGLVIDALYTALIGATYTTQLTLLGATSQNFFASIRIGGTTLNSADATFGGGEWIWANNINIISGVGTYSVRIV